MAVVKLGTTASANRLISYCEKRAAERDGVLCDPDHAKSQFKATRSMWGKEGGIQAHHVIMSFPPYTDNMTVQEVAQAGRELAERLAPGHEAAVYVHTDKDHWHAHIVINAVNCESGKKLHLSPKDYFHTRDIANDISKQRGWHTIEKPYAAERYTMAERELIAKGQPSWKDELRSWIREGKQYSANLVELKDYLEKAYGVHMKIQQKNVSFLHPDQQKYVRGKSLGEDFTKEGLNREYELERTSEATRAARQSERSNERAGPAAGRTHSFDRAADRRAAALAQRHRGHLQRSGEASRTTSEILQKARTGLQHASKQFASRSEGSAAGARENATGMARADLQPQGKDTNVPVSGLERGGSGSIGADAIKNILNSIETEMKRLEAAREHEANRAAAQARRKGYVRNRSQEQDYER